MRFSRAHLLRPDTLRPSDPHKLRRYLDNGFITTDGRYLPVVIFEDDDEEIREYFEQTPPRGRHCLVLNLVRVELQYVARSEVQRISGCESLLQRLIDHHFITNQEDMYHSLKRIREPRPIGFWYNLIKDSDLARRLNGNDTGVQEVAHTTKIESQPVRKEQVKKEHPNEEPIQEKSAREAPVWEEPASPRHDRQRSSLSRSPRPFERFRSDDNDIMWTPEQDAEIIRLVERLHETSWSQIYLRFRERFPTTTHQKRTVKLRYKGWLQADAYREGLVEDEEECNEARAMAISILDTRRKIGRYSALGTANTQHIDTGAEDFELPEHLEASNTSWSAEEDGVLLHLREEIVRTPPWAPVYQAFQKNLPRSTRSLQAIRSRYSNYLAPNAGDKNIRSAEGFCEEMRNRALAFIVGMGSDYVFSVDEPGPVSFQSRLWTTEHDAEILRLREKVFKSPNWDAIAKRFKQKYPATPRTPQAIRHRYSSFLAAGAVGRWDVPSSDPKTLRLKAELAMEELSEADDGSDLSQAEDSESGVPITKTTLWTIEEDAELIRLRESGGGRKSLYDCHEQFKVAFPGTRRTYNALLCRYRSILAPGAIGKSDTSLGYCEKMRERALDRLKQLAPHEPGTSDNNPISLLSENEDELDSVMGASDDEMSEVLFDGSEVMSDDEESEEDVDGDYVTIVIGREREEFHVPPASIQENVYFTDDAMDTPQGIVITGARWQGITPELFQPIYEYLCYNDYEPKLERDRLSGVNTDEQHKQEVVRCAHIFNLAKQMLLDDLMTLAAKKLAVLRKEPFNVLMAVRLVYGQEHSGKEQEETMRQLLVDEVASKFRKYVQEQHKALEMVEKKAPRFIEEVQERIELYCVD